jgi:hypothetical protein
MINIAHRWGADYLLFDEPIQLQETTIISPQGICLQPGQTLSQIGRKRRSSFSLMPGLTMTYQGLLYLDESCYAIFYCPAHEPKQISLFDNTIRYRYAFTCVFVEHQFQCFLIGPGGPKGMYDIQLDFVA